MRGSGATAAGSSSCLARTPGASSPAADNPGQRPHPPSGRQHRGTPLPRRVREPRTLAARVGTRLPSVEGSSTTRPKGSPKAVAASSKVTPCLRAFAPAFFGSHSTGKPLAEVGVQRCSGYAPIPFTWCITRRQLQAVVSQGDLSTCGRVPAGERTPEASQLQIFKRIAMNCLPIVLCVPSGRRPATAQALSRPTWRNTAAWSQ
jgi:hypothetical protein